MFPFTHTLKRNLSPLYENVPTERVMNAFRREASISGADKVDLLDEKTIQITNSFFSNFTKSNWNLWGINSKTTIHLKEENGQRVIVYSMDNQRITLTVLIVFLLIVLSVTFYQFGLKALVYPFYLIPILMVSLNLLITYVRHGDFITGVLNAARDEKLNSKN
jgi:hypothetical protein